MNWTLETFLVIDALVVGAVVTLAIQHALAHFKPDKHDAERRPQPEKVNLPPEVKKQMQEKAKANFEATIDKYTTQLQKDLRYNEASLSSRLDKLSADIINRESGRYKEELDVLRQQIAATNKTASTEMKQQQADLEAQLKQDFEAEKQRRITQLDTKISDAVTSFLLDTMGREVDLGAQSKYIMKQLEEHKAEIIKGVSE